MLNPNFCFLDPDSEHLDKLASLAKFETKKTFFLNTYDKDNILKELDTNLNTPGIYTQTQLREKIKKIAEDKGLVMPERYFYNWPYSILEKFLSGRKEEQVFLLGIFEEDRIWAGCIVGLSQAGLDWLTTFDYLWQHEPELASQQQLLDLPHIAKVAGKYFGRSVIGLFIYKDEFITWRDSNWSKDLLHDFAKRELATIY